MGKERGVNRGVGSRRRAGKSVRRMLREELRAAAKRNRRHLVTGAVGWVVLGGVLLLTFRLAGYPGWAQGFVVGVWVGLLPFFWNMIVTALGFRHRYMGADAEQWTAEELAKLDRRRWSVFHDVLLEDTNIDHVVVGPRRIYAVETKWLGNEPTRYRIKALAGSAAWRADQLRRALQRHGVSRNVRPIVVLWGPGARELATPQGLSVKSANARIVFGLQAESWREEMNAAICGVLEIDAPALEAVRTLCRQLPPEQTVASSTAGSAS